MSITEENTAGNAICSICYEDLKPVVENLQSISACGHVFHELCLQQWFEYCPNTNKRNCPICKQKCSLKDPCRLYFQSSGDQIDSIASSKKTVEIEEDPVLLRVEVKRLQGKIHNLSSSLDNQKKENAELSDKLQQCNEQLKEDKVKRWESLQEISTTQHLLKLKSEECIQLTSQCAKLHERTMALAKELAALKLVSDLSLEEDDVLKLAMLGNNAKSKDTIDTLVKSLVIRNRSYKELLAKCSQLGRGEARSSEKLEKALEKIDILKKRMRELELITEERDNRALRTIKTSKNCSEREVYEPPTESLASFRMLPSDNIVENISTPPLSKFEKKDGFTNHGSCLSGREGSFSTRRTDSVIDVDDDVPETTSSGVRHSDTNVEEKCDNPMVRDIKFNIRNDSTSAVSPGSNGVGNSWLSSGTNRNLSRWSKHGERNEATPSLGPSVPSKDDLIAIGPDGKGGRIKVLRSKPQISSANASSGSGKRFKLGTKTSGSSSQGCLQIEHYFGRPNR